MILPFERFSSKRYDFTTYQGLDANARRSRSTITRGPENVRELEGIIERAVIL
jgi:hypothetical protein